MQGSLGSRDSHRDFSLRNENGAGHPGADIIWQGCVENSILGQCSTRAMGTVSS